MTPLSPDLQSTSPIVPTGGVAGQTVEGGTWRQGKIHLGWPVACLLGLALIFNPYVIPSEAEGSPRLSDLISVLLAIVLLVRWVTGYRYAVRFPVALWVVLGLIVVWFARERVVNGTLSNTDPLRWLLAVPYAYALHRFASRSSTRSPLVFGLCIGAAANVGVIALQAAGLTELTVQLGLASGRWSIVWISGVHEALRPTGMWGHPNASAGVIALCFPLACGLIDEKRLRPWWIVLVWFIVFASSVLTYTRSGILVSAFVFLLWTGRSLATGRYVHWKLSLLLAATVALAVVGPPGGWWRWINESDISQNSAGRFDSTFRGTQLALRHPLGIGADYQRQLAAITSEEIQATHNGWLYLALVGGLPFALFMLFGVTRRLTVLRSRSTVEGWLALSIMGLFFFEEFLRVPCFIVITLWLAIKPQFHQAPALERSEHALPEIAPEQRPGSPASANQQ